MESLTISPGFVALGSDCRGALALPWTKIGQQRGAQEVVTIDEPLVGFWLKRACEGVLNDAQLMTGGPHQFRTFFQQAITTLGLQELGFKPYSLRRGGATHDFLSHHNVQRTLMRGRWGDVRTGRIYITDGAAQIASLRISPQVRASMQLYSSLLLEASGCNV